MKHTKLPTLIENTLTEKGYTKLTKVQEAVLEVAPQLRDLLVSSQTGSGKTVAYGLAMSFQILSGDQPLPRPSRPLALIITPTRELALQVKSEISWMYRQCEARVITTVGGMSQRKEQSNIEEGVHILVGTPGRIRDHLTRYPKLFSELKSVVLDEADEILKLGFREDIEYILSAMPEKKQTLLFSATLPKPIFSIVHNYQHDPIQLKIADEARVEPNIVFKAILTPEHQMIPVITNLLLSYNAETTMVFCNTRLGVTKLHAALNDRHFSSIALSGEMEQHTRNVVLQRIRNGQDRICVATDVVARGIDIPSVSLVIHADLPTDAEKLQHRSGRTGRAGRSGTSIILVPYTQRRKAERLFAQAKISATWCPPPAMSEIDQALKERMIQHPSLLEPITEQRKERIEKLCELYSKDQLANALIYVCESKMPKPVEIKMERPIRKDVKPGPNRFMKPGPRSTYRAKPRMEHDSRSGLQNVKRRRNDYYI